MTKYIYYGVGFWAGNLRQLVDRYSAEFRTCRFCNVPDSHYWLFVAQETGNYDVHITRTDVVRGGSGSKIYNVLFNVTGQDKDKLGQLMREMASRMNIKIRQPPQKLEDSLRARHGLNPKPQANQT